LSLRVLGVFQAPQFERRQSDATPCDKGPTLAPAVDIYVAEHTTDCYLHPNIIAVVPVQRHDTDGTKDAREVLGVCGVKVEWYSYVSTDNRKQKSL